jgi:hypothetical protein
LLRWPSSDRVYPRSEWDIRSVFVHRLDG